MPMWNEKANWDYKVEKVSRSLHLSHDLADEMLRDLEKQRCYDDDCEGQMRVLGIKGIVKDVNGDPHPRETFYECVECGHKWLYDFQDDRVSDWKE